MDANGQFVVGWGTLALINAGIAQGKARGGMNWFLLSLLFGPIATFVLLLLGKRHRAIKLLLLSLLLAPIATVVLELLEKGEVPKAPQRS